MCADTGANHRGALQLLRGAVTDSGILASIVKTRNYQRIWARDAVISGLAGILLNDERIIDALGLSLNALADCTGPVGQVPSNVGPDDGSSPSYGKLAGRLDAGAWFVVGTCHLLQARPDWPTRKRLEQVGRRALELYEAWELNSRGLVYCPLGSDWADEYVLHGYVLGPNLLRLWALRCAARLFQNAHYASRAATISQTLEANFWIGPAASQSARYHPSAYQLAKAAPFWRSALSPAGYDPHFDTLSNALAMLLGIGTAKQQQRVLEYGLALEAESASGLMPAFWPVIGESDPQYRDLQSMAAYGFRNLPGQYHNGGVWPMVNGFWIAALIAAGERAHARALLAALATCNRAGDGEDRFYEFHELRNGRPGGTPRTTWSAAGELIATSYLNGQQLDFGSAA